MPILRCRGVTTIAGFIGIEGSLIPLDTTYIRDEV